MAGSNRKKARGGPAGGAVVNDDLRREIAEQLLAGVEPDRVAQRIAGRGIALALAGAEVDRAAKSPYLRGAAQLGARLEARLGKRDWVLANLARLARAAPLEVPRRHALDPDAFFAEYYRAHRPVLLTGLIDHWPAMQSWSLDMFERRYGAAEIRLQWGREADRDYEANSDAHGTVKPFAEMIRRLREDGASNDFYMTANNHAHNRQALAGLWADTGTIPGYLADELGRDGFLWIGPRGTITPWHHDLTNNLLLQISGTKRVRLVASHDTPLMRNSRHCFSDWGSDELVPGPAGADRPAVLGCDIGPGEALFLPVGWWHHVEALDVTIGMSFTNFAADNDFHSHYASYGAL